MSVVIPAKLNKEAGLLQALVLSYLPLVDLVKCTLLSHGGALWLEGRRWGER